MNNKYLVYLSKISFITIYYLLISFPLIVSAAQVTLEWNGSQPAPEGYRVFKSLVKGEYSGAPAWFGAQTACTLNDLQDNTTYFFVVRAYQGDVESGNSNEVEYYTVTTPPVDPDRDDDGYNDDVDAFPDDPNEWLDTDGDGIGNNADEDDDGDGMPDSWEKQYGLDPLTDDAGGDLDGDGVSNIDEYKGGTDPSQVPGNIAPAKPVLLSPGNGTVCGLVPDLIVDDYSDPDGDSHVRTRYQIALTGDFSSLIFEKVSAENLLSIQLIDLILDPDTTYYWRARFYDERNGESEWSDTFSFTTIDYASAGDSDGDGILNDQEVTEDLDMDGDGTTDSEQDGLVCLKTTDPLNPHVAVKRGDGSTQIVAARGYGENGLGFASDPNRPESMTGLVSFKLYLAEGETTATVTIYFSRPAPIGAKWYKYSLEDGWVVYPNASFSHDRMSVSLVLVDGGTGDQDGVENGIIVDPAGAGYTTSSSSSGSSSNDTNALGGGCFIASVNAENASHLHWSPLVLVGMVFGILFAGRRRKRGYFSL